ncbi:hypothetical protein AB8B21_05905 [Tardiphaga sp. 866_E4_N2_1]|uniref:hypothetical protein n=1 Tax=unclassified Tardiphaga TaxID=2631404 RepID=UPI003F23FA29
MKPASRNVSVIETLAFEPAIGEAECGPYQELRASDFNAVALKSYFIGGQSYTLLTNNHSTRLVANPVLNTRGDPQHLFSNVNITAARDFHVLFKFWSNYRPANLFFAKNCQQLESSLLV